MDEQRGRRLSVLHVILNLGEANGQYNEHCLPMTEQRDIAICTYFTPQLTPPPTIALHPGDGTLRAFFRAFREALAARRYDVLHVHAPQSGALVAAALLVRLQYRRWRRATVYTVQDSYHDYSPRNRALMLLSLVAYHEIVFCSRAAYDSVPRRWRWLVRGRWRVIQNALDVDRVDRAIAEAPTGDDSTFVVIAVGRLEPVKDPFTLLEAFAKAADDRSRLVLVGAGSLEAAVRERIEDLGIGDRVELTGLIPRDAVFVRCAAADVLVSTSRGEGLPVAVMEAMAARCPVILSDIPPHRELVDTADLVPLVPIGDAAAFAEEIGRAREWPPAVRRQLGQRSRDHVVERYTLPIMHAQVEALYRSLPPPGGSA